MIVKNGDLVQVRKMRKDGWTPAVRAQFLDVLAATCNITTACVAVDKSPDSARKLKRRDGQFAQLWTEAYAAGRERLEEELIACALGQIPSGYNPSADRETPPPLPPFDPNLAIKVLQLQSGTHHSRKKVGMLPVQTDVDNALVERLEALADRLAKQ